jgi:hypothetical protein
MKSKQILLWILIIVLSKVFTKNEDLTKSQLEISTYFKNFTGDIKFPKINEKMVFETQNFYSDESAIINTNYEFQLPVFLNSSTEILGYTFDSIKQNNTSLIRGANYYLKQINPSSLVTNNPKKLEFSNKDNNTYSLEILYNAPSMKYSSRIFNDIPIENARSFHNLIFGLSNNQKNNLYIYEYDESTFNHKRLNDIVTIPNHIKLEEIKFDSLHIYENIYSDLAYLILKTGKTLYIFKFERITMIFYISLKINFYKEIIHESLEPLNIHKIILKDHYLFVGEKRGMIQIYDYEGKSVKNITQFNFNGTPTNLYLQDMILLFNSIYVISEDYGIKILNISDIKDSHFTEFEFYHPYLKKLDTHINPYREFMYVGVLVSDRYFDNGNEFFFELKIIDEFHPVLNRYYLNNQFMDINYFISDHKFSYLYEHFSNSIYVIIRSNIINENNSVFKIQIPELHNQKVKQELFFVNNKENGKYLLAVLTENDIIVIDDIYFTNAYLNLKFNEIGKFVINLNTNLDYCDSIRVYLIKDPSSTYFCSKNISFEFNVTNGNSNTLIELFKKNVILFYIFLLSLFVIMVIFVFLCYRKLLPHIINLMRDHKYTDQMDEQPKNEEVVKVPDTENNQIDIVVTEIKE